MEDITYDDFQKIRLITAEIKEAVAVPKTDKLVHLKLDIGQEDLRDVVAGIREHYQPEDLVGKKIVYLSNLEPRKLRGILSRGMVLAAASFSDTEIKPAAEALSLLFTDKDLPNGTIVG
tara:strand:+ start:112 stop:468 length:357 start_codon:yes stop_codon:yes gene_type:complete